MPNDLLNKQTEELFRMLSTWLGPIFIGVFAASVRFLMLPRGESIWAALRGVVVAAFTAVLAWQLLTPWVVDENFRLGLTGVAAFLGDDILMGVLILAYEFKNDPKGVLRNLSQWRFRK